MAEAGSGSRWAGIPVGTGGATQICAVPGDGLESACESSETT
ncbi:hypothetical protein GMOD_00006561 [Pyrenophora seminiperda CCB06]|uniref:Uncharacterized protein n=1 Tax=Pyrenophora seminiperda CCB06 TaxID=1302712 RepID=A0A3M7MAN8_9PLEO|nr:hypothetical protein GMOD_00006561 [Pyrenophora seminiperda CCB06]